MSEIEVPESWAVARSSEVCSEIQGGSTPSANHLKEKEAVQFIKVYNLSFNGKLNRHIKPCFVTKTVNSTLLKRSQALPGDVLINIVGPPLGKVSVVPDDGGPYNHNQAVVHFRPRTGFSSNFLSLFFQTPTFQRWTARFQKKTSGQANLSVTSCRDIEIPLPPTTEQERIVAKIESCFSKIAAIEQSVDSAESLLKKYRDSLLAKAFRGELVPQDPKDEPASKLLARIRTERDKSADGKKRRKDELPPVSADEVPFEIPKSWAWVRLGELALTVQYGSSSKTSDDKRGIPVLRMGNIQSGRLDFANLKYLPKSHDEFPSLFLDSGDLIFNRTNSPELVGKCAIYTGTSAPCSFASYLIRVSFDPSFTNSTYIAEFINSPYGRDWIASVLTQQVGQANVNGTKLKESLIPLPPIKEQNRIVKLLESKFYKLDSTQAQLGALKGSLSKMKESILHQAFSGRLVAQDPSEGTGHELLARIQSQAPLPPDSPRNPSKKKTMASSKGVGVTA